MKMCVLEKYYIEKYREKKIRDEFLGSKNGALSRGRGRADAKAGECGTKYKIRKCSTTSSSFLRFAFILFFCKG